LNYLLHVQQISVSDSVQFIENVYFNLEQYKYDFAECLINELLLVGHGKDDHISCNLKIGEFEYALIL